MFHGSLCTLHSAQEQEKADLLESCRALSDEAQCLTSTAQQSMGEVSGTRLELLAVSQEKQHLAELVQQQASEIQQVGGRRGGMVGEGGV